MKSESETDTISVVARSPRLAAKAVDCVVTIPTFKRPDHLMATLDSLARQETQRRFAVIVVENEAEERAGAEAAKPRFTAGGDFSGLVIVAHERGNCAAYNAGWETALKTFPDFRYLLVMDDDEIATPGWLDSLCRTAEALDADIIGGPVLPVFSEGAPKRFRNHPIFRPIYEKTGVVPALFGSGNLLIRRKVLEAMEHPYMDLRFNFIGGGDADFLMRAAQKGFRLAWCEDAVIHETVPARRLEADWVRARSLRNGVISALVEKRKFNRERFGGARVLAKSLALLGASPLRAARRYFSTGSLPEAMYPVYIGLGRVMAEFGYANEQYREPEKN